MHQKHVRDEQLRAASVHALLLRVLHHTDIERLAGVLAGVQHGLSGGRSLAGGHSLHPPAQGVAADTPVLSAPSLLQSPASQVLTNQKLVLTILTYHIGRMAAPLFPVPPPGSCLVPPPPLSETGIAQSGQSEL